jgi:hypothetical protein
VHAFLGPSAPQKQLPTESVSRLFEPPPRFALPSGFQPTNSRAGKLKDLIRDKRGTEEFRLDEKGPTPIELPG